MVSGRLALILLASALAAPAAAADCKQSHAIYADRDGGYELRFEPVGSPSAATSNHFKVAVLKPGLLLDGVVMPAGEPERATGLIMHNCPEGDATGEELRACTVWQGVVYALDKAGAIGEIPAESEPAAAQLLLPDFGPSLRASGAWGKGKAEADSWDSFALKGCAA
ncbi:hypothetical protein LAC81_17180 [Ensifer adhaerens]|uniref:hypothetical protein n=1 Tax=Ensifer adhaerens TaxID=106592 RepID=UPI001CBB9472|nr:hypothetical protein [Ensifer adhaerens]MBZ7923523.1 hypothetical protein [Ensifer adhaerens]UAX92085.1 hypothetical protein LAC78_17175 [Ensifer adhaerens]UAX99717.1 hypothetical protein LAC80_17180 [Ensifer adhaerens]UAY07101.1 hypothetical protein LAC81_17180 [Ensifer adhaerens]